MSVHCITVKNNHLFNENLLFEQFKLRYRCIVERQDWNVLNIDQMEFDQYDNPACIYFVCIKQNRLCGVVRLYPTTLPYMLEESFPHLVTNERLPKSHSVWEGSRFCVDKTLPSRLRKRVAQELILSYLEYSLQNGIESIVGIMVPTYWKNVFINNGWDIIWLGDVGRDTEGKKIVAARLPVSGHVLDRVRESTGIHQCVLSNLK